MTAQSLVPMGVVGISSLNEIRLRKMQKSSRMKVERQAKVGHVPAGTTFSPGAEPFDTQSTKLDQRGLGRGLLQFLATQGGTRPYQCPLSQNQLQITTSGWMGPISSLVGNGKTVSNSRGIQNSWFCIELRVYLKPTHYSLRHGWTSADGALYNWNFLGSPDGHEWFLLCKHLQDRSLATGGYSAHTW
eukprot:CAMPEP_0179424236 /NCGR_PEP_ID=MMETSP0799-20121207/11466_1 /TAXON_ID=46947 /ORGANISM="Geminigera cryophila, Strain CCMP2564" /LENGTH=187 /DNA_ID=CAMNT_0021198645 /DNA_START=378 /DNA_END=938 /DNA_ORIENTATION=-